MEMENMTEIDDEFIEGLMESGEDVDLEADDVDEAPEGLDNDAIEKIAATAVRDAIDFIASEIVEIREKSQRYFDGQCDLEAEEGRSKVVATKTRDTVRAIKPSLMRIFLSSTKFVEYIPNSPADIDAAAQATAYAHWKFRELNGYRVLSDVFHDALVKKMGIARCYYEEKTETKVYKYTDLQMDMYEAMAADPEITILEVAVDEMTGLVDAKISRTTTGGDIKIDSIPPEEFFFDRNARSLDECYVCGQRTDMRVGDLIAMGFDEDDLEGVSGSSDTDPTLIDEDSARRGYQVDPNDDEGAGDPSMRKVLVTEAYMRIAADGSGIPVLHRVLLGGIAYKLLSAEPCDDIPYAVFEVDPEPHTMLGRSIADLTMDDQDGSTAMLRGLFDNAAMVNNPRIAVVESNVNMSDVLNPEIGAIVRMRQPGAVQPLVVPFTAGQTLSAVQYLDGLVEQKTGVTRASMGLDPDAMQSTTKAAVNATVQAAAGQVEVMARNLAEGGARRLFQLLLRLTIKHSQAETMMRLGNNFVPADPRVWDATMGMTVTVGLGTGREEEKAAAYREILGLQMQVWQGYGPQNGVVSLTGIVNTVTDMLASAGIHNADRYFTPMTPQTERELLARQAQQAQQAAAQNQQGDPNAAYVQVEQLKASVKAQSDERRAVLDEERAAADHERKLISMALEQDLKRDSMAQDRALSAAELMAKYGLKVDEARIRAEQAAPRGMDGGVNL